MYYNRIIKYLYKYMNWIKNQKVYIIHSEKYSIDFFVLQNKSTPGVYRRYNLIGNYRIRYTKNHDDIMLWVANPKKQAILYTREQDCEIILEGNCFIGFLITSPQLDVLYQVSDVSIILINDNLKSAIQYTEKKKEIVIKEPNKNEHITDGNLTINKNIINDNKIILSAPSTCPIPSVQIKQDINILKLNKESLNNTTNVINVKVNDTKIIYKKEKTKSTKFIKKKLIKTKITTAEKIKLYDDVRLLRKRVCDDKTKKSKPIDENLKVLTKETTEPKIIKLPNKIDTISQVQIHKTKTPVSMFTDVKDINTFFSHIYLINLDRRPDRLQQMNKILIGINFDRVSAVDGNKYNPTKLKNGEYGCLQSHINIITDALEKNYDRILILEDDVLPIHNFYKIFSKHPFPNKWDILYLGGNQSRNGIDFDRVSYYYRTYNTLGTFAYALPKHMYQIVIDEMTKYLRPSDLSLIELQKKYYAYVIWENLFICDVNNSDIQFYRDLKEFSKKTHWNIAKYVDRSIFDKILVVMGNGPSLKNVDFSLFKNVSTFGLNSAYRAYKQLNFTPTYYGCFDNVVCENHIKAFDELIKTSTIKKFFFVKHNLLPKETLKDNRVIKFKFNRHKNINFFDKISSDFNHFYDAGSSGANAVQCGIMMGYNKILLIGCDCNYVEIVDGAKRYDDKYKNRLIMEKTPKKNPNYWFDDYQQKGDKFNVPNTNIYQVPSWENIYRATPPNIQVINCSSISKIDVFQKSSLDKELKKND